MRGALRGDAEGEEVRWLVTKHKRVIKDPSALHLFYSPAAMGQT